jgi:hypothetical protein
LRGDVRTRLAFGATVLLAAIILPDCGSNPSGPSSSAEALSQITNSSHYTIHSAPGDGVNASWQDAYYEWLIGALQLGSAPQLEYYKYRNRAHLLAVTGRDTNGFAEPGTTRFHTIWPTDNHEGVHTLVILQIGQPPALFNEGVAVAYQMDPVAGILTPRWSGADVHALARQYDVSGRLPALTSLLRSPDFFNFDPNMMYPCAGSFVRYLIDKYGLGALKTYFGSATFDDAAALTESRFFAAYGRSVASVWDEWRAWIASRPAAT